jgi:HlyD family secretion protein
MSTSNRRPRSALSALLLVAGATGCGGDPEPDAYGNFEATEVVVSAETTGQIVRFEAVEGTYLAEGEVAALIDTTQLALEREQIEAQLDAVESRGTEAGEQQEVLQVQAEIARRAYERTRRLHSARAATSQQLDQAERDYRTLLAQIDATRAQRESVGREAASSAARVAQIADRIARGVVRNPRAGTVLTTYARSGEMVQPGQPLYRVADTDTLDLRAYVTGTQLARIRVGQPAEVRVDGGEGDLFALPGTVTWISSSAEFTPTPIQTRDERADLVYAVRVRVPNPDGMLKIGMPADVVFRAVGTAAEERPDGVRNEAGVTQEREDASAEGPS